MPPSDTHPSPLPRWRDLILGRDRNRRFSLSVWSVSCGSYALYWLVLLWQVHLGFAAPRGVAIAITCAVVFNGVVYGLIRSGWSARLGKKRAGLATPQLVVGMVFMWVNYALIGPNAGATLIILASHMVYAVFGMSSRHVYRLAATALVGLGATMTLSHQLDPLRYPADVQLVAFAYALVVVPLIALLSNRVASAQTLLRQRGDALTVALARVEELATRDALTGTWNRRHMSALLQQQHALHERGQATQLCLALIDIDHFKGVNDRLGHAAGDTVLQRFSQLASSALRSTDLLSRWGGEEFLAAFPSATLEQAETALERLRSTLAAADFTDIAPKGLRITCSAGLTELRAGETIAAAIDRADQAMYRAKTGGRDRIARD